MNQKYLLIQIVLTLIVLTTGCQATQKSQIYASLQQKCTYQYGNENVYHWQIEKIDNLGHFKSYYSTDKPKRTATSSYPKGLMVRCTDIDESSAELIDNSQKMSNWKLGPEYLGCQLKLIKTDDYAICFVYEETTPIGQSLSDLRKKKEGNFKASLLELLKRVKIINDKGYYYNSLRPSTITLDSGNNFLFVDPDFMIRKTPTSMPNKPRTIGGSTDAPPLFRTLKASRDIDDLYSASMAFCLAMVTEHPDEIAVIPKDIPKNIYSSIDCFRGGNLECIQHLSRTLANALGGDSLLNTGAPSSQVDKFWKVYEESAKNWGAVNKAQVFGDLNLATLLRDLWSYDDFKLNAAQFMDLLEFVSKKRILI